MKLACVQTDVVFQDPESNAARACQSLRELRDLGVDLAVFPEAYLTGYCVECVEDAGAIAIERESSALASIRETVDELGMAAVIGFAERHEGLIRNTAVLFESEREPRFYWKTHLPDLGLDKFVESGDDLPVFETRFGKIGILICFDLRYPEAARTLAIKGAELIVLPTNWPVGAQISAEVIAVARAAENRIFIATCNRCGDENGFHFFGGSKIVHPTGKVLAEAGEGEATLIAKVELSEARAKRIIGIPGKYETEAIAAGRPELYQALVEQRG